MKRSCKRVVFGSLGKAPMIQCKLLLYGFKSSKEVLTLKTLNIHLNMLSMEYECDQYEETWAYPTETSSSLPWKNTTLNRHIIELDGPYEMKQIRPRKTPSKTKMYCTPQKLSHASQSHLSPFISPINISPISSLNRIKSPLNPVFL